MGGGGGERNSKDTDLKVAVLNSKVHYFDICFVFTCNN